VRDQRGLRERHVHRGPVRRTDLWLMIGRDASMITGRETMEQRRRTSSGGSRASRGLAASSAVAWLLALGALLSGTACGSATRASDGGATLDAGADAHAGHDADVDASSLADASTDAQRDAAADAAEDASDDAGAPPVPALLALNLHCLDQTGTPYATLIERLHATAALAIREGVVAMLLEEVCDDGTTRALDLLTSALSTRSGDTWRADEAFAHVAWQGTPQEARESVALLTRTAHGSVQSIDFRTQGALRRVALMATLGDPLPGLRVMVVHLDHLDSSVRVGQARESAVASLATFGATGALVAGDFNARVGTPPLAAFEAMGFVDEGDALPSSRIDHILLHRGASLVALETRLVFDTPATAVSDHPGILIRLAPTTRSALSWTRITAHVDPGAGHFLALRGDTLPLDWARGWPMFRMDASTWVFMAAEVTGGFEYKVLVDDTTWMTGANASGVGGVDQDLTPTF